MKPEGKSLTLLKVTKSQAKMWEYDIPIKDHIKIIESPDKLFPLSIALLGDLAAEINREHENTDYFEGLKKELLFSAEFFNSFYEAKLLEKLSLKLRLLASAAYYLCDMPGNAKVLADSIKYDEFETETELLNVLLVWILKDNHSEEVLKELIEQKEINYYSNFIRNFPSYLLDFYKDGKPEVLLQQVDSLRKKVYADGTDEQLLLGDIIAAVIRKKIENASIYVLPSYTDIDITQWESALVKQTFIREFWPAQHLLGKMDVLRGKSAVIQMPTSAGKTKSTELILRSAFLSNRTKFAIIVAPFRALCHEIADSLKEAFLGEYIGVDIISDVLQNDIDIDSLFNSSMMPEILIVTPEKLLYILRHVPNITEYLKLVIFDEGHQFDTGKRGITYELLLTSLKKFIPENAQKILISAVISNAEKIGEWLNGENTVVNGNALVPTSKSIGFASWKDTLGQIKYVSNTKDVEDTFFVPRVIEAYQLKPKKGERKRKEFPEKENGQDIALFLGLKLCVKGGVAIFCGRKDTAINICKRAVKIVENGYSIDNLQEVSNNDELSAISELCSQNFGIDSIETKSARFGILAHHNNMPHGIRLAVEYAMREDKIRIVVCTSTLAQGVNLPIRYLVVSSLYQGQYLIKVRDFHNLIGRAGRAGKHLEGSILFADSKIYDNKAIKKENWRWEEAKKMLDISKSELCDSSLLVIFEPIKNDKKDANIRKPFEDIVDAFIKNQMKELAVDISEGFKDCGFDFKTVYEQLFKKCQLLESLENFLLAHWEDINENIESWVSELAKQTLAFHLADDNKKVQIIKVFQLLSNNIVQNIQESKRKKIFGKILYGVNNSIKIETWVNSNQSILMKITNIEEFIEAIWQLFCDIIENNIDNDIFVKFDPLDIRKEVLFAWLAGKSFAELLALLKERKIRKIYGERRRDFTVEDMVDICENTFAFEGTLLISAMIEFLDSLDSFGKAIKEQFKFFQKCLNYGLPDMSSINLYELGFSDRFLSQKIASFFNNQNLSKREIQQMINEPNVLSSIQSLNMPSYFKLKLQSLQRK